MPYEVSVNNKGVALNRTVNGGSIVESWGDLTAVSYTHLDVYKRQVCVCARIIMCTLY